MVESKCIVGHSDYEVTSDGNIISCKRNLRKQLKPGRSKPGYLYVNLWENGKPTTVYISRIVAEAFIGSVKGMTVNHKDCDKSNNNVDNLEIITQSENVEHAFRMGVHPFPRKPVKQINQLGQVVGIYESQSEAAKVVGIFVSCISCVVRGKTLHAGGFLWESI